MDTTSPIKDILYQEITNISEDKIQLEISKNNSSNRENPGGPVNQTALLQQRVREFATQNQTTEPNRRSMALSLPE